MKRSLLAILMAAVMCLALAGCSTGEPEGPFEEPETPAESERVSDILKNWDLQLTDEEVLKMSNFMAVGEFIVVDGNLYGSFGGEAVGKGTFSVAKIKDGDTTDVSDRKTIEENSAASYLTEHEGYIYGILNWDKIVKIKAGESKAETIYEGACDYLQIKDGKIYFTDEKYRLCNMDLSGGNVETVIDQADMYYTYVLSNDMVVYQNDPDNESLHIYDLKTKEDVKLNDVASYGPIIHGDYLYYTSPTDNEEEYTFHRVDLYTGKIQDAPCIVYNSEFVIENGKIIFSSAGMPTFNIGQWDELDLSAYGGLVVEARYSDGHIRVLSDSNAEIYIKNNEFIEDGKTSIGFNYIMQ